MTRIIHTSKSRILSAVMAVLLVFALLPGGSVKVKAAYTPFDYTDADYLAAGGFDWSEGNNGVTYNTVNVTTANEIVTAVNNPTRPLKIKIVLLNDIIITEQITFILDKNYSINNPKIMLTSNPESNNRFAIKYADNNKPDGTAVNTRVINVDTANSSGVLFLENIEISNGNVLSRGGGIYGETYLRAYILSDTLIQNNIASLAGGGICCNDITMFGGSIRGNESKDAGGGICWRAGGGTLSIYNGEICHNTAESVGGGVEWYGPIKMYGGKISDNTADTGGGIRWSTPVQQMTAVISAGSIINNHSIGTSEYSGGGGFAYYSSYLYVSAGVNFSGNTAVSYYDKFAPDNLGYESYNDNIKVTEWSKYYNGATQKFTYGINNYDIYAITNDNKPFQPIPNSINIFKYQYDESYAGYDGTGVQDDTIPNIPLEGVPFTVYQVNGVTSWNGTDSVELNLSVPSIKINNTPHSLLKVGTINTGSDGLATFGTLPDGLYLVVEESCSAVMKPAAPFLVNLPMEDPDAPGTMMKDVYVYPKNEVIKVEKLVNGSTYAELDSTTNPVTFTITVEKPNNYDTLATFVFTDELDALLTTTGAVVVEVVSGDGTTETATLNTPPDVQPGKVIVDLSNIEPTGFSVDEIDHFVITFSVKVSPGIKSKDALNTASVLVDTVDVSSNTVKIHMKDSYELPHTGGTGLLVFTILGVAIVGVAGGAMALRRKKREE